MTISAPSRYLVLTEGFPDRLVTGDALPALLAADDRVRLQGWLPGAAPVPLQLFPRCTEPGSWQVVLPGIAGETEPVLLATITADGQP